jgi:hypothetical protein
MIAPTVAASTAGLGLLRSFPSIPSTAASLPPDRRGRLRNGARPGDFLAAPRCGARTRCGGSCRQPAMPNGRCRMHGGLSTGPRTPEGRARCARARLTHGGYSTATRALRAEAHAWTKRIRGLIALMRPPRTAGHGVLPPISRSRLSPRAVHLLSGTAALAPFTAGHRVLPSFSAPGQFPAEHGASPAGGLSARRRMV